MCNVQVNICTNKFECNRILAGVLGMCIFEKGGRCNIDAFFHFCLGTRPGEGRSRACWSNLWKGKWGCGFYLTHVSFSPSVPSHNPFEQSEHGIHLRSPLGEDINLKDEIHLASAKKRKTFFITIYRHRPMLFHNQNKIVKLTMLTHLDAFPNEIQEEE